MLKQYSLILLSFMLSISAQAEIHRYVDENGKVHFTDKPPANVESSIVEVKINTYQSSTIVPLTNNSPELQTVIMYSTSWCGNCKKAKKYFKKNRVAFKEYDIEKSKKAKREFDKLGGRGVPVILVGKQRLNGFSAAAFERIYQAKK